MSVICVVIKIALLRERLVTHCTREADTLLTVFVGFEVLLQGISCLERRSTNFTRYTATILLVLVYQDVILQAVTVLEGRAAQVARQAGRDFNKPNQD